MSDINKSLRDLEKEYSNEKPKPSGPYIPTRSTFPVNLVLKLLLIGAAVVFIFDRLHKIILPLLPKPVALKLEEEFYPAEAVQPAFQAPAQQPMGTPIDANIKQTIVEDFVDGQTTIPKNFKNSDFVQIYGKYYRTRKDNLYLINGERVFFCG